MSQAAIVLERAAQAASAMHQLDQVATDAIVHAVHLAALDQRIALARQAQEETGLGVWQHKVIKNAIAAQLVYEDIKHQKTSGVISEDIRAGIVEVAQPLGPVLGLVPVTNPTSTTIFKALIAMKTRNPLIVSAPPAARHCVAAAAAVCARAAIAAGAPEYCIQCLDRPSPATIDELMADPRLALIVATGTEAVVRRAARSGTLTVGVGPGNVPAYIGVTADVSFAVRCIVESKTFDNGTVCASEQSVVVRRAIGEEARGAFERQGGHFMSRSEIDRVGAVAWDGERGTMAASVVGQSVAAIAERAGIRVPDGTALLLAPLDRVGPEEPLSGEILAPVLSFYVEEDFEAAIRRCSEITRYGGVGHTAVIHSNHDEKVEHFAEQVDASRVLVNTPATHGALGGMYNALVPSFTLSCGSSANNHTTDNISVRHLLNVHRIARRRPNPRWTDFDQSKYLDETLAGERIEREYNQNY